MYSYWSGHVQGTQENLMDFFESNPTFFNALMVFLAVSRARSDFVRLKKKGIIDGELLPFDNRIVKNLFTGARNSIRGYIESKASASEPQI